MEQVSARRCDFAGGGSFTGHTPRVAEDDRRLQGRPLEPQPIHGTRNQYVMRCLYVFFASTEQFAACTLDSVRRQLLQEEADARKTGTTYLHDETPASFLRDALDIEEKQCVWAH